MTTATPKRIVTKSILSPSTDELKFVARGGAVCASAAIPVPQRLKTRGACLAGVVAKNTIYPDPDASAKAGGLALRDCRYRFKHNVKFYDNERARCRREETAPARPPTLIRVARLRA